MKTSFKLFFLFNFRDKMNKWIEALKIFNKGKVEWCVPKKGTTAYNEVQRIMNRF